MDKQPFLYRFAETLPEVSADAPELHYDPAEQMNVFEDGTLAWKAGSSKPYTNVWTSGHVVPGHYTPKNKWVPSKNVPGKYDRRAGK